MDLFKSIKAGKKESSRNYVEEHYKSSKAMLRLVGGRGEFKDMGMKKYFQGLREYIFKYEQGKISSLWDFYKTTKEMADEWRTDEEEVT